MNPAKRSIRQHRQPEKMNDNDNADFAIKGAKAISLFPTEVWIYPPESHSIDINRLQTASLRIKCSDAREESGLYSARHAWRLENPHLKRDFKDAYRYIQKILSITTTRLGLAGGVREFGSWLNIIEPGGYHVVHNHAPNLLSGVLYLSDCSETARLILRDPRPSRLCFPGTQSGPTEVPVASSAGSAIIFPGWLEHWVEQNSSDHELTYIAFNLGNSLAKEGNISLGKNQ